MKVLARKHTDGGFVVPEFDDSEWNRLPSWQQLREALDKVAHESEDVVEGGQREFLEAVLRLAASLPLSDRCFPCRDDETLSFDSPLKFGVYSPYRVEDGKGYYTCPRGHFWTCGWARFAQSEKRS